LKLTYDQGAWDNFWVGLEDHLKMLKLINKRSQRFIESLIAAMIGGVFCVSLSLQALEKKSGEEKDGQKHSLPEERIKSSGRTEAYYHFSLARMLEESGDFTKAIDEYKKAIQQDPQSSYLYIELANAYLRHRRVRDAVQEVENAIRLNPDNLDAHKVLGTIYYSIIGSEDSSRNPTSNEYLKKAILEYEAICRLDPSDSNSLLALSRLYRYDGQSDNAIASLKKFLQLVPSSEAGLANLAQIYADQGNFQEAINVFKKALASNPNSPTILAELASTYEQSKDYKNAIETYRKAMEVDEDSLDLRKGLAQVMLEDNQDELAEKEYLKILEADPDEGVAYLRLGQIYRKRHDYEKALEYFNKANAILVGSFEVPFHIATLYEELGKFEKAEERFQQLLKLTEKPARNYTPPEIQNRSIFLTHAGYVAQQLGKYPQAIEHFTELKSLSPENALKAESYIIDTYRDAKQLDKALATCESALKANPEEKDLRILCTDISAETGKSDEAIKSLQQMLVNSEEDFKIYYTIIQIYQRDKKFKEAERTLSNSEKYFKNKESYYFMVGANYERQKEYDKAEAAFKKALELNPKNAAALNYYGYMLADRGDRLQQSLDLIKQAVDLEPNNGAYLDSLGWVYFKLNQTEEAEIYLKKALDRVRKDPTVHEHLGDVYYRKGQYEEARNFWEFSLANSQDDEELKRVQKKVDDLKVKLASLQKK
jgi:tetratricopeptide (TPR) repeat protein